MNDTKQLEITIGTFHWTHSDWFDNDEADDTTADCLTCGGTVTASDPHWYCDENGEVVHEGCEIPNF
jgi:hypothetical protein